LVEYNIPRNNHITLDDRPSTYSVLPYVAFGQKCLETPGVDYERHCLIYDKAFEKKCWILLWKISAYLARLHAKL